jgi:hypothetical protein
MSRCDICKAGEEEVELSVVCHPCEEEAYKHKDDMLKRLREALEWYAKAGNNDGGTRARRALKGK